MSSKTTRRAGITYSSFNFVLKWILKGKELIDFSSKSGNVKSDLYQVAFLRDSRFFLEIDGNGHLNYNLKVKGSKMWSFKIPFAFLVSKNRAFKLVESNQLSFLPALQRSYLSNEEEITIHCLVNAYSVPPDSSIKEDDLSLKEGQGIVDLEDIPPVVLYGNYKNEIVIDFIRRGELPDFTVDIAVKIIGETKFHECNAIKALCSEYLMKNITAQSIKVILKAAIEYDLPQLERECTLKIARGHFQIK